MLIIIIIIIHFLILFDYFSTNYHKEMSWQGYIDNFMATKHFTHAGIYGLDGSKWAVSPGIPVIHTYV